jgi:hypothetical protein
MVDISAAEPTGGGIVAFPYNYMVTIWFETYGYYAGAP